ncbi:MAG: hypothetical protein IBJ03_03610 [Gemmatimonadaceae bacterium]|nr:hypothetical protein [Gemmatimonadaceae bacterium]
MSKVMMVVVLLTLLETPALQPGKPQVDPTIQQSIIRDALMIATADDVFQKGVLRSFPLETDPSFSTKKLKKGVGQSDSSVEAVPLPLPPELKLAHAADILDCRLPDVNSSCTMKRPGNFIGVFGVGRVSETEITVYVALMTKTTQQKDHSGVSVQLVFSRDSAGRWSFAKKGPYLVG